VEGFENIKRLPLKYSIIFETALLDFVLKDCHQHALQKLLGNPWK
jgi:hypothetical protein